VEISNAASTALTKFNMTLTENLYKSSDNTAGYRASLTDFGVAFNNTTVWEKLGGNATMLGANVSFADVTNLATATVNNKVYVTMGAPSDTVLFGDAAFFYTPNAANTITNADWQGRYDGNDAAPTMYLVHFGKDLKVISSTVLNTTDYEWNSTTGVLTVNTVSKSISNYNAIVVTATAPAASATLTTVTGGAEYFSTSDNTELLNAGAQAIVAGPGVFDHIYAGMRLNFTLPKAQTVDNISVVDVVTAARDYSFVTFSKDLQAYNNVVEQNNSLTTNVVEHTLTSKMNVDTTRSSFRAAITTENLKDTNGTWNTTVLLPVVASGITTTNGGNATLTLSFDAVTNDTVGIGSTDNTHTVFAGAAVPYELFDTNGGRLVQNRQLTASLSSSYTASTTSVTLVAAAANTQAAGLTTDTELAPYVYAEVAAGVAHNLIDMATAKFEVQLLKVSNADKIAVGDTVVFADVDFGIFTGADTVNYNDTFTTTVSEVNTIDDIVRLTDKVNLRKYDNVTFLGDVVTITAKDAVGNSIHTDANEINLSSGLIK
jgi:hypothetical protein